MRYPKPVLQRTNGLLGRLKEGVVAILSPENRDSFGSRLAHFEGLSEEGVRVAQSIWLSLSYMAKKTPLKQKREGVGKSTYHNALPK